MISHQADRLPCCVPFCGRTIRRGPKAPYAEWICAKHWALVDRALRRRRFAARRRGRLHLDRWFWRECKRQAIERTLP